MLENHPLRGLVPCGVAWRPEVMLRGTPEGLRGTEASTSSSKDLNRHRRERTERHWSLVPEHLQDGRPHDVVYF